MSTKMPEQELLHIYDEAVSLALSNLHGFSMPNKKIQLLSFNRRNIEHIFLLRIALMARDVFGLEIEIDAPWRDVWYINRKIRKGFRRIKKMAFSNDNAVPVHIVLNYMRDSFEARLGNNFSFGDIYHTYYEGSIL